METYSMPVINIENFRQWIESKQDTEPIGIKASCAKCPIAQYLNENFVPPNYRHWLVNGENYYPIAYPDCMISELPKWAKFFVEEIDNLITKDNVVYKDHCLTALDRVAKH